MTSSDLDPSLRQFLLRSRCPFLSPTWTVLCAPTLSSCSCQSSFVPSSNPVLFSPLLFLGPDCVSPSHSAPLSYHNHYPQNPPASPALLVHTECPRDYPMDDTIHQSVLHMPHHMGTAPSSYVYEPHYPSTQSSLRFILWLRVFCTDGV